MTGTPCVANLTYGTSIGVITSTDANNVFMPQLAKATLRAKPMYSENTNHISSWENVLEVEAIIYDAADVVDIEVYTATVKKILERPGLNLRINYQGIGQENRLINPSTCLRNGPYPQETIVQPFAGNKCLYIKWVVAWYDVVGVCDYLAGNTNHIIDISQELDFEMNDEGEVRSIMNGKLTFRNPMTNNEWNTVFEDVMNVYPFSPVIAYYHSVGYSVEYRKKISFDKRTLDFTATFKEREAFDAYYPYTAKVEGEHSVESSMFGESAIGGMQGFRQWNSSISVNVKLPPRIHKAWALVVFRRIVNDRLRVIKAMNTPVNQPKEGTTSPNPPATNTNRYIPLYLRMAERIGSRDFSFNFEYMMVSDLDLILSHSNMFTRINTIYNFDPDTKTFSFDPAAGDPATIDKQWYAHRGTLQDATTRTSGAYDYQLSNVGVVRFSPCDHLVDSGDSMKLYSHDYPGTGTRRQEYLADGDWELTEGEHRVTDPNDPLHTLEFTASHDETNSDDPLTLNVTAQNSWAEYQQSFEVIESTGTVPVQYMEAGNLSYYNSPSSGTAPTLTAASLSGMSPNINYAKPLKTNVRRPSRYSIVMRGHAIRVKYPIPTPAVISVNGQTAYRTGKPRWKHVDIAPGSKHPVYLAMWEIEYTINGSLGNGDAMKQVVTNGTPGDYV